MEKGQLRFCFVFPGGPGHGPGRGYGDHPFLAAAAVGKFPGKSLGKLEPPAELAAAMTFLEADCLFVRIVIPGEVFHLGRLLLLPICAERCASIVCTCACT